MFLNKKGLKWMILKEEKKTFVVKENKKYKYLNNSKKRLFGILGWRLPGQLLVLEVEILGTSNFSY